VRALAETGRARPRVRDVRAPGARARRPAAPGTSYLEREGTYVNLEGRLQRLRRPSPAGAGRARVDREARRALRRRHPAVRARRSRSCRRRSTTGSVLGDRGAGAAARSGRRRTTAQPATGSRARGTGLRSSTYRPLFSGPPSSACPSSSSSARTRCSRSRQRTRVARIANGDEVEVSSNGTRRACARASRASSQGDGARGRGARRAASRTTSR
jgi:hypothetical protein